MKQGDPYTFARLESDMQWVKQTLSNHLKHHERYEIALIVGILLMIAERVFVN